MKKAKTGGLGRGLGALGLGKDALTLPTDPPPEEKTETAAASAGIPAELSIDVIQPNRFQPRREFDEAALEELRESIAQHGILQPVTVRDIGAGKYELIAEEAHAYQRLLTEFKLSQEQLARRVARSRSAIANSVRLLRLAKEVQAFIANGVLTMGQARPLLALETAALQREAAEYIQEHELSARGVEALVKRLAKDPNALKKSEPPKAEKKLDIFVREAEERLTRSLGTKVRIQTGREEGKGRLEISYFSAEDLERLLSLLTTSADGAAKEDKRAALRAFSTQKFTV